MNQALTSDQPVVAAARTTPPGRYIVLYDGLCRFCQAGAHKLAALARPGVLDLLSYQELGVLDRFPGVPLEACQRQLHLITPDGRVFGGVEAIVQALATRRGLRPLTSVYYVPGLRRLFDALYALVARHRYRILGRTAADSCASGACAVHFRPR
jgi:predicted DCC family thiol-disulfide oxidoreductase YuxK